MRRSQPLVSPSLCEPRCGGAEAGTTWPLFFLLLLTYRVLGSPIPVLFGFIADRLRLWGRGSNVPRVGRKKERKQNPTFSGRCIGFLVFNAKKTQFLRIKPWFYSNPRSSALGTQHRHSRRLGPSPYNLNLSVIKPNKTGFC